MELGLFPEFEIALVSVFTERSIVQGQADGASRFIGVGAIREAAVCEVLVDIGERVIQSAARPKKAQLAHSRCIDQHGTTLQHKQLASGRGMDTFPRPADRFRVKLVTARQSVDKCGLSNARGAQQAMCSSGAEKRTQLVQACARYVAERDNVGEGAPAPNLLDRMFEFTGRYEVCLGQQ